MDFQLIDCPSFWKDFGPWCALFAVVVPIAIALRRQARGEESASLSLSRPAPEVEAKVAPAVAAAPAVKSGPVFSAVVPALLFIGAFGLLLSTVGGLLHENVVAFSSFDGERAPTFTAATMAALILAYFAAVMLLAVFRKTPRAAAWSSSIFCLLAVVWGCRALSMRWSVGLFFGLMPLGVLLVHAQARLREEERASLSIRRQQRLS